MLGFAGNDDSVPIELLDQNRIQVITLFDHSVEPRFKIPQIGRNRWVIIQPDALTGYGEGLVLRVALPFFFQQLQLGMVAFAAQCSFQAFEFLSGRDQQQSDQQAHAEDQGQEQAIAQRQSEPPGRVVA